MLTSRSLSLTLFLLAWTSRLPAAEWRPLDPSDLTRKQSKIDPNAAAEALFRDIHISNEQHGASAPKNIVREYVRLKIFTDAGKDFGNVQIPYFLDGSIYDIQGRTIHPDGKIIELSKDSIFEKVIQKRGFKTKVVSFAMPGVEAGSVVEYRFSKNEGEMTQRYRQLEVQSSFPVDEVTFFVKPLSNAYFAYPNMRLMPFGCTPERLPPTNEGFDVIKVKNVPAFHDEPYSPPEYSAKQWILIYYEENSNSGKDKYWTALGKDRYREYSNQIKVNGEMKELAAQITAGAANEDDKLAKLLDYCRTQLKDTGGDEITTAQMSKAKENRTTLETIHHKQGTTTEINYAFIALAQAAGFDARRADISDRSTFLFAPVMQSAYFLNTFDVAVNVNDTWRYFDVANKAVPAGRLRWQEQGVYALVDDPKNPELIQTPMLTAQQSIHNRMGTFSLSEDGTLEGDVREMLYGNHGISWREENRTTNETQREEALREVMKSRFSDVDVSKVHITANPDASKPVGVVYHIVIHNYAQRTGKRFFINPNFFAAGYLARFSESSRHNNVYFEYPWSEADNIDITLPAGFDLDHADSPGGIEVPPTCSYRVKIGFAKDRHLLEYRRQLFFGDKDILFFEASKYPTLKKIFDVIHDGDNHMITFKSDPTAAATVGTAKPQ